MTRKYLKLLLIGSVLLLGGCTGRPRQAEDVIQEICEFPEHYENTIEKVTFDAGLEIADGVQLENLKAGRVQLQLPDVETVKAVFLDGLEEKKIKEKVEEKGGEGEPGYFHLLTEDFYNLSAGGSVVYNTPDAYYYRAAIHYDDRDNLPEEYVGKEDLDGMSANEALDAVRETLQKIGITTEGCLVSGFTLPHTLMEEKEVWEDHTGNITSEYYKESWTREDDAYYYVMHQTWQGLPVYHKYVFPDNNDMNAPIRVLWSRRGLEDLQVDYYFRFKAEEETLQLKDFSQITATVADKYNAILNEVDYLVMDATLYQTVVQGEKERDYFTIPAWLFHVTEKSDEGEYTITMLVDAVSGKEIVA
ncbi:hypothetical protein D7Y05_05665 [bacterium 1XD42-54]|nr:hypothetical protein D7Y05_05665 [bacterium 1XD42-54]